jgi:hypothetical protein
MLMRYQAALRPDKTSHYNKGLDKLQDKKTWPQAAEFEIITSAYF